MAERMSEAAETPDRPEKAAEVSETRRQQAEHDEHQRRLPTAAIHAETRRAAGLDRPEAAGKPSDWTEFLDGSKRADDYRPPEPQTTEYSPPETNTPTPKNIEIRDIDDAREALLSGHSVKDVRQAVTDHQFSVTPEETTQVVREDQSGIRYELGHKQSLPERFAKGDAGSLREQLRRPETIEGTQDVLDRCGNWVENVVQGDPPAPQATRSPVENRPQGRSDQIATVGVPTDRLASPAENNEMPEGAAALWTLPVIGYVMADRLSQWTSGRLAERRQARGEHSDAGD